MQILPAHARSGSRFSEGDHIVVYEGTTFDGKRLRCTFHFEVQGRCTAIYTATYTAQAHLHEPLASRTLSVVNGAFLELT